MVGRFARGRRRVLTILGTVSGVVVLALTVMGTPVVVGQATRTWVSGVGDDANPCSRTAPCKTFAGAISKTATGGEINVLDPGGFGAVTITKPITISSIGFEGGVLVSGTNGIVVNTVNASDNVVLSGLDIEGLGTGLNGVNILQGNVDIRNTTIHNFATNGVNVSSTGKVLILNSVISFNGTSANPATGGVDVSGTAVIENTTLESNGSYAVRANNGGAAFLSADNLVGTGQKIKLNGGTVTSYGNNVIRGSSDTPSSTVGLQ
jgi:hypothetical protein